MLDQSFQTRNLFLYLFLSALLVIGLWSVEKIIFESMGMQGLPILLLEVLTSVGGCFIIFRKMSKNIVHLCLFLFFLLTGFADLAYFIFFYFLKQSDKSLLNTSLTTFPYLLSYLFASLAIYLELKSRACLNRKFPWFMTLLLISPIMFNFIIPSFQIYMENNVNQIFVYYRYVNTIFSLTLISLGIYCCFCSRSLFWTLFSMGSFVLIIVNWSLTIERFLGTEPNFGFYEYLWSWAKVIMVAPLLNLKSDRISLTAVPSNSLSYQLRFVFFAFIMIGLLIFTFNADVQLSTVKILAIGFVTGILLSVMAGQLLVEKVELYSALMGTYITRKIDNENVETLKRRIPDEILTLYNYLFHSEVYQRQLKNSIDRELTDQAKQLAHDINSPLMAFQSCVKFASATIHPDALKLMNLAIGRMSDITKNLLVTDKKSLIGRFQIKEIIGQIVSEKKILEQNANIHFSIIISEHLSLYLNRIEFARVISNLLNNAIDSLDRAEKRIAIFSEDLDQGVVIHIQDSGSGIPQEFLTRIQEAGFSFAKESGHGLGLSHAGRFMSDQNGLLRVSSQPGSGTTVSLHFLRTTES